MDTEFARLSDLSPGSTVSGNPLFMQVPEVLLFKGVQWWKVFSGFVLFHKSLCFLHVFPPFLPIPRSNQLSVSQFCRTGVARHVFSSSVQYIFIRTVQCGIFFPILIEKEFEINTHYAHFILDIYTHNVYSNNCKEGT